MGKITGNGLNVSGKGACGNKRAWGKVTGVSQ